MRKAITVKFYEAQYLGGLPAYPKPLFTVLKVLSLTESEIKLGLVLIPMSDVATIKVDGGQVAKSKSEQPSPSECLAGLQERAQRIVPISRCTRNPDAKRISRLRT